MLCALLVVLRLPLVAQSYSISEEQLNEIQAQTEIMRQSVIELSQQLQELNAQLIESQRSLQKSKKINSVLVTVLAGMAAGTVTIMILK